MWKPSDEERHCGMTRRTIDSRVKVWNDGTVERRKCLGLKLGAVTAQGRFVDADERDVNDRAFGRGESRAEENRRNECQKEDVKKCNESDDECKQMMMKKVWSGREMWVWIVVYSL